MNAMSGFPGMMQARLTADTCAGSSSSQ